MPKSKHRKNVSFDSQAKEPVSYRNSNFRRSQSLPAKLAKGIAKLWRKEERQQLPILTRNKVEETENPSKPIKNYQDRDEPSKGCLSEAVIPDEAWVDSLETSDNHQVIPDPDPKLIMEIEKLGSKHGLQLMRWSHSSEKHNTIIVSANYQTSDRIENVLKSEIEKIEKKFEVYQIELINVSTLFEALSGNIIEKVCDPNRRPDVKWIAKELATCELILRGYQPHKDRFEQFAVTSAHLLLTKEEMKPFQDPNQEKSEQMLMKETKDGFYKRMDRHAFVLKLGKQLLPLAHLPMLEYRMYQDSTATGNKVFMNDIAVLPLEGKYVQDLDRCLHDDKFQPLTFCQLNTKTIALMAKKGTKVFAEGRQGKVVDSPRPIGTAGPTLGHYLSFRLEDGRDFEKGDSGTLISTKSESTKFAVGLLWGREPSEDASSETKTYVAIVLGAALKEIEENYRQLISKISIYHPRSDLVDQHVEHFV